jgi:hypothetical protein
MDHDQLVSDSARIQMMSQEIWKVSGCRFR